MKQHYTKMDLSPKMDPRKRLSARPICGQRPRNYVPAMTNDWSRVDCSRCLSQKPGEAK